MEVMPNNLDKVIAKSGMSKKEVAALKGITPETLSRQIHGKIQMTLQDAEHYAKILDCTPQQVLFPMPPIQIVGSCSIDNVGTVKRSFDKAPYGHAYTHFYNPDDTALVYWDIGSEYTGIWQYLRNGLEAVFIDPIKNQYVHPDAKGFECYALLEEPYESQGITSRIAAGVLYPEPGNRYTIHNGDFCACGDSTKTNTLRGQKLIWATPVLNMVLRPQLRGFDIHLNK